MVRGATVYNNVTGEIYFSCSRSPHIYSYHPSSGGWTRLQPPCPHLFYGLALVRGQVTALGGQRGPDITGTLITMVDTGEMISWEEEFPAMPTPRLNLTALSTRTAGGEKLLAIGGLDDNGRPVQCVEVLHVDSQQWTCVANLPRPADMLSPAIATGHLYLLGGTNSRAVYTASLQDLMQTTPTDTKEVLE